MKSIDDINSEEEDISENDMYSEGDTSPRPKIQGIPIPLPYAKSLELGLDVKQILFGSPISNM